MFGKKVWVVLLVAVLISGCWVFTDYLPKHSDSDGDGLSDWDETYVHGTDPKNSDTDMDGLRDGLEVANGLDPLRKNPCVAYALSLDFSVENSLEMKVLDVDEVMSENEKKFIDYCNFIVKSLIPEETRRYYLDEEILGYQRALIESILPDGISDSELRAIDGLRTNFAKRWYVQRDIICSGMVSSRNLDEDWDKDSTNGKHLSNLDEILQGTNPLNDLETDPNNLSERYAILVNSAAIPGDADLNLEIYHLLKRNGYNDRNIELFFSLLEMHKDTFDTLAKISDFPWLNGKHSLKDFRVEIDYEGYDNITPSNFLNSIRNLPSDENDMIFVYYVGHYYLLGGRGDVSPSEMNRALNSIKYGKSIFLVESCYAERYVKDLGQPYSPRGLLAIGSTSKDESAGSDFSDYFFVKINEGKSIKEAFDCASEEVTHHPVIYYYGSSKECPWIGDISIVVYIKKASN